MKKRIIAFVLGMLLCFGSGTGVGKAERGPVCFEDDLGRTVTVEEAPQRVVVLIGSFAHMWYLAGGHGAFRCSRHCRIRRR